LKRHVKEGDNIYVIQDIYGVEEKTLLEGVRLQNAMNSYNAKTETLKDLDVKIEELDEKIEGYKEEAEELQVSIDKFNGVFDEE